MTISLSLSQQIHQLPSLQNEEDNFLLSSSSLIFFQNKNQLIYHGYHKPKANQQLKGQGQAGNQEAKPKKKFVFKMGKDKDAPKTSSQPTQKVHVFQINTNSWNQLQIKGKLPAARENHRILMLNSNMLLMYGGKNLQNDKILNDLHALNLQTLQWKKLFSIEGPPPTENFVIIKLSQTKIALVSLKQVWTFESKEVKWQLNANELPGGLWENLNMKFQNPIQSDSEHILGGMCIRADLTSIKLLVFSCHKQKGVLSSYFVNFTKKEIIKIKMNENIILDIHTFRHQFFCFQMGIDAISEEYNQALLMVKNKGKQMCYLVDYNEINDGELNIITKAQIPIKNYENGVNVMGKCLDANDFIYSITYNSQNPKKKMLQKIQISLKQNVSQIISQVEGQKKLNTQNNGYINSLNPMKTSQIQSIAEESNQSSVIGMKSNHNQRQEEFQGMDTENFIYQMRRTEIEKNIVSGANSLVNRSPSALSDEIDSDVADTERNNESMARRNEQQVDQKQSYQNDSSIYISSRTPVGHQQMYNNNSTFPQQQHLQKTLQKILVYEHIRRLKLQQRGRFLQKAIQKTEQLAKLLTKFSRPEQKQRHIRKVMVCKEQFEGVWNKEMFYRRQMERELMVGDGGEEGRRGRGEGRIDMGRLMRRHLGVGMGDEE